MAKRLEFRTFAALGILLLVSTAVQAAVLDLLVADVTNNVIQRYNGLTGAYVGVFASGATRPVGVAWDSAGNLAVGWETNNAVNRYDGVTGALLNTWVSGFSPARPNGVTVDAAGNLLVGRRNNGPIVRYDVSGVASPGNGEGGANFTDAAAQAGDSYGRLRHSTYGPDGNLYVSETDDGGGNEFYKFNGTTGDFISSVGINEGMQLVFGPSFNAGATSDLYLSDNGVGVKVFEGSDLSLLATMAISAPRGLAFNPNTAGQLIVVTGLGASNAISIPGDGTYSDLGAFLTGGPATSWMESTVFFVPEPATMSLLAIGGLLAIRRRR